MNELIEKLRGAFQRKRYGGHGEYDPDFDLFDAAADTLLALQTQLEAVQRERDVLVDERVGSTLEFATQLERVERERWISVDDKLPELNVTVLIWSGGVNLGWCEIAGVFRGSNLGYDGDSDVDDGVTHWMPLPALPSAKTATETE